jgi:hypothetical protein
VAAIVVFHFTTNINNEEIVIMSVLLRVHTKELLHVKGLKKPFDLSPIIPIHKYVSKHLKDIKRNVRTERFIGNAMVAYSVNENGVLQILDIEGWVGKLGTNEGLLKIITREHFHVKSIRAEFDMSVVVSMHDYVLKHLTEIERNVNIEHSEGNATVVYSVDDNDAIYLLSGWPGSRKKQ